MNKKKEKIEKKSDVKQIDTKKVSTFKKKKKTKKTITSGIAYVYSTFNNTIISIADESGNVISWLHQVREVPAPTCNNKNDHVHRHTNFTFYGRNFIF